MIIVQHNTMITTIVNKILKIHLITVDTYIPTFKIARCFITLNKTYCTTYSALIVSCIDLENVITILFTFIITAFRGNVERCWITRI